jgi:MFS family permease
MSDEAQYDVIPPKPVLTAPVAAGAVAMLFPLLAVHALIDLFSGVWPIFKHMAGISLGTAGLIATVASVISWSLQPLFGIWADRGHMRACILWGVALSFPMMLLGPMGSPGTEYSVLVISAMFIIVFLSRLGQALFHPAAAAAAGDLARGAGRSGMVALFVATGWAGYAFNQWAFAYAYENWSQHTEWLLVPGGLLLLWAWIGCHPKEHNAGKTHRYGDALKGLHSARHGLLPVFLTLSSISAVEQGLMFLLPEFVESRGAPAWAVNGGALMCFVAGTVTFMIPAGFIADRVGRKLILVVTLSLSLVTYLLMILAPGIALPVFFALMFVSGGMINTAGPIGVSIAQHLLLEHKSLVTGMMMGLTWTAGAIAPLLMGVLAPRIGLSEALLWLAAFNVLSLICVFFVPKWNENGAQTGI